MIDAPIRQSPFESVVASGATIFLSGMSAKARGLTDADLRGLPMEFAMPNRLVQLALDHDRMFTY